MDENRIEELEHNGYLIQYTPKLGVRNISTNERNLTFELLSMWRYNNFHSYTHHLYDFSDFQMEIKNKIIELCILAKNIKQTNGELYCHISSHIFGALAEYPQILRNFHLYMNALKFWKFILQIIKEWEGENPENEIHKGAIYGFIAETNMNIGDYEIAFTNLHRAVREDFNIEEYIPDYGRTAPGYKIITLRPSKDHWMWGYVREVRDALSLDIRDFNNIFKEYAPFDIKDFDLLFIENKFFDQDEFYENLKITASYYIWQTYYYAWKIDRAEKLSTFDNLNRLPKLLGICVTIESLANEILGKEKLLLNRMDSLYKFIGGTHDFKKTLYPEIKDKDEKIHLLLEDLLNYNLNSFAGITINEIDRCILIYSLIRNFTAHNVKSIEAIGEQFFNITQSLLFLSFVFLLELKKAGKIG